MDDRAMDGKVAPDSVRRGSTIRGDDRRMWQRRMGRGERGRMASSQCVRCGRQRGRGGTSSLPMTMPMSRGQPGPESRGTAGMRRVAVAVEVEVAVWSPSGGPREQRHLLHRLEEDLLHLQGRSGTKRSRECIRPRVARVHRRRSECTV